MTYIYGLYDPRDVRCPMYVGKGLEKRANGHWKYFLSSGKAVSGSLRRWFEKLKVDDVQPTWQVLEVVEDWDWPNAERAWIYFWRLFNRELCNVTSGGRQVPITEEVRRKIGQFFRGKKLSEEHRRKLRNAPRGKHKVPRSPEHCQKIKEFKLGQRHSEKTCLKLSETQRKVNHERWHLQRNLVNKNCKFCLVAEEVKVNG